MNLTNRELEMVAKIQYFFLGVENKKFLAMQNKKSSFDHVADKSFQLINLFLHLAFVLKIINSRKDINLLISLFP